MIYVASSWRNKFQPMVVAGLRTAGYEVYDYKTDGASFDWNDLGTYKQGDQWMPRMLEMSLCHGVAKRAFVHDMTALHRASACVLVLPAGRSAHLEAGWMAGKGQPVFIYAEERIEPELMYLMNGSGGNIHITMNELLEAMRAAGVTP